MTYFNDPLAWTKDINWYRVVDHITCITVCLLVCSPLIFIIWYECSHDSKESADERYHDQSRTVVEETLQP
jgi:hypothetical protein